MRWAATLLVLATVTLGARADPYANELIGELGNRAALLSVSRTQSPDGAWRITGEYLLLDTLQRRFLAGEGGPTLSVTTLKEGTSPIVYGRPPTATLQGVWRDGAFEGMRYGPGGQVRERFKFSATFPSMAGYGTAVQCGASEGKYSAALAFVINTGRLRPGSLSWTSRDAESGDVCVLGGTAVRQVAHERGLRFQIKRNATNLGGAAGDQDCTISVRDLGEVLRVSAAGCSAFCGARVRIEPILVDGANQCRLLRPIAR